MLPSPSSTHTSGHSRRQAAAARAGKVEEGVAGGGASYDGETNLPSPIILVGRTGLDAALRLDTSFEVVRAEDGPCALGHLSLIEARNPGQTSLVVVSGAADPARRPGDFAEALRLVSAGARFVRVAAEAEAAALVPAGAAAHFDGFVDPSGSPAAVRAALRTILDDVREPTRAAAPIGVDADAGVAAGGPAAAAREDEGALRREADTALVRAMLTGRDPIPAALDVIRAALRNSRIHLELPKTEGADVDGTTAPAPSTHGVLVRIPGQSGAADRVFGTLAGGEASDTGALGAWSDWLANWLALKEQQEQLRAAAFVDDVTGAWNRRYFDRFLSAAMKHAGEHGHSVTVLYFDIDDFKKYNDAYGHAAGDEILRETVRLLQSVIRPTDRVCRIGGDEFGVIFHEPDGPREPDSKPPASIWSIAMRFQRQVCEHRFPKLLGEAHGTLTISGGLASFPIDGTTPEELVCHADQLSIQSKRQGKNAITLGHGAEQVCRIET